MAKAVVPLDAFRRRFGDIDERRLSRMLIDLLQEFLHEAPEDKKKEEPVGSH
jgi:hypothetical protein